MKHLRPALLSSLLLFTLGGCASSSLSEAPPASNTPWIPDTNSQGAIIPHSEEIHHTALKMPPGYTLPEDQTLPHNETAPHLPPDHNYSLAELIDIAQSVNPSTRIAWNTARDSALSTGIARSAYLPQLTASVLGGYGNLSARIHQSSPLNGTAHAHLNGDLEMEQLGLQWLLFDFGKRRAILETSRQITLATNILFNGTHQKVIYNVTAAYYRYIAAQAHVKLVEHSLQNAHEIERAARANLQHGQGTIVDISQAEQATAQAELALTQIRGDVEDKYLTLLTTMGLTPTLRLSLHHEEGRTLTMEDIHMSEKMVHDAVSRRPDVLAAYAKLHAAQSSIKEAKANFLPQVFMSGNVSYSLGSLNLSGLSLGGTSSPFNSGLNNFGGLVFGGISMPIFDGGLRQAQLKQSKDRENSAQEALHETQDNSLREIVTSENNLHTDISAHNAALKLQKAAQTGFDAALNSYHSGEGSMTRMLELQNSLLSANIAASDSYYATLISAASLAFATGALGDTSSSP